jgi:hypothetical protein
VKPGFHPGYYYDYDPQMVAGRLTWPYPRAPGIKVFWFFFSKKNILPCSLNKRLSITHFFPSAARRSVSSG